MEAALQVMRNLGPMRLAVIGAVTFGLVGFFLWIVTRLSTPQLELLYADLDVTDSARIVAQLESARIPFEIRGGGGAIYVPADRVPRTRLTLAEQGLPAGGSIGYEIFDNASSLGTTNFIQNVNLVRALEGELARTIRSIDAVKGARVHLVLPKRELFSRDRQEPSASVLLHMHGANRLTQTQIVGIQNLVASAVPGLNPLRISIVDGRGSLLAQGFDDGLSLGTLSAKTDERRELFERRLARTVEQLLERTVGAGKVRAEVFADMNFDRINTSEEVFDPDGQVVRSTQAITETSSNREGDGQLPVSVATNLPDARLDGSGLGGAEAQESRNEETVNYEISKKVINHVRETGIVKRLSVAVLVDGVYGPAPDGSDGYQPRSQQELDLLATLVRSAIGFDGQRGDTVEVINMRFVELDTPEGEEPTMLLGLTKNDLFRLAQYLVLIVFAVLAFLLVVRPLMKRFVEATPLEASAPSRDLLARQPEPPALAPPVSGTAMASLPAGERTPTAEALDGMIDLQQVEGRVNASAVKKVGEIVDKHPEEALSIIRGWLYAED
ncbi:MAG: flagellar basal-body MS-ring/collar protein FliF [Rhodospirillales bacterium]